MQRVEGTRRIELDVVLTQATIDDIGALLKGRAEAGWAFLGSAKAPESDQILVLWEAATEADAQRQPAA